MKYIDTTSLIHVWCFDIFFMREIVYRKFTPGIARSVTTQSMEDFPAIIMPNCWISEGRGMEEELQRNFEPIREVAIALSLTLSGIDIMKLFDVEE